MDSIQPIILIVDDEKHTRDGLRRLLEDDYDVYVAGDIASAMNVLEREHVDLVLTDLRLGGEDGMQLIDRALKMPQPAICIMMTAYGSVGTAGGGMKSGALRFRLRCSKVNCSDTKKVPSPVRMSEESGDSSKPTAARFSWMKSATFRRQHK